MRVAVAKALRALADKVHKDEQTYTSVYVQDPFAGSWRRIGEAITKQYAREQNRR